MSTAERAAGGLLALLLGGSPAVGTAQEPAGPSVEPVAKVAVEGLGGSEVPVEERWLRRPASLGLENAYRDRLRRWARGDSNQPWRYAWFQALVTERIAGVRIKMRNFEYDEVQRGMRCLAAIEQNTAEKIGWVDPELTLVVAAFHLAVYDHLVGEAELYWLADENWGRLGWLRKSYRGRPGAPDASAEERLAALEMTVGGSLQRAGLIGLMERARDSFERAVRFAPENPVARYWFGFLEEKLGNYRRAAPSFEWLVARETADPEAALRLALLRSRLGSEEEAIAALEIVAGPESPPWVRVVAVQELARLLAPERPEQAIARVRALLPEAPDPSLALQLAQLLGDDSEESDALISALTRWPPSEERSPRLRYVEPREQGLAAEMAAFEAWLIEMLPALAEAIDVVEQLETTQGALKRYGRGDWRSLRSGFVNPNQERPAFRECAGFKLPKGSVAR